MTKMTKVNFSIALCEILKNLGVEYVFGVSGGAIGPFWYALEKSQIRFIHCKHESGASFAATEAYFATGHPTVVTTTTGPGITNTLTGLFAARIEGAKVIFISGHTPIPKRGRYSLQETAEYYADIYSEGTLFNYTVLIENADMLPLVAQKLRAGLATLGSFIAHLSIPIEVQTTLIDIDLSAQESSTFYTAISAEDEVINHCIGLLSSDPFSIWLGFGSRHASKEIQQLAELTGSAVMCTPRARGIFPEDHPQFVGVTGFGGHDSVYTYVKENKPSRTLVLGTKLGEISSFWDPLLVPPDGFIHVDIDPSVPGTAYPLAKIISIQADIKSFVTSLLKHLPKMKPATINFPQVQVNYPVEMESAPISPVTLLHHIQKIIVEGSNALVMADAGNSFAWATHLLQFRNPNRFRVSSRWGAMGNFVTGVIGAALAKQEKVVVIAGDGAMLMNNEINTAVKYDIPAVWIVLNDSAYNMCEQGQNMLNMKVDTDIPPTNFVNFARSQGADGIRVEKASDIAPALHQAMKSKLPFVVDVIIDAKVIAPIGKRVQSVSTKKDVT